MKRLWKTVPPVMSDVLGFQAVINATSGLGIIDDPSRYKPVTAGRGGGQGGGRRNMDAPGGFRFHGGSGGFDRRGSEGGRGHRGGEGGRGRRGGDSRVTDSEIRNEDIITGTEKKVMEAFTGANERISPDFVLLCHAPSSSMIGSDLETDAERITGESGLPAARVDADGSRDYLYGVSVTLETMGKLLLTRQETIPDTVNILGANPIDWTEEALASCESWLAENGWRVLSRWGMKETTENLRNAASAEVNLAVSAAGLRLARYMQAEYGVPYVCGAPFGEDNCRRLLDALRGENAAVSPGENESKPTVLVVAEQLTANAIRTVLEKRGMGPVRVVSFYEMDKAQNRPGDRKLGWEDALREELETPSLTTVFCDPDCRPLTDRPLRWIDLPNGASHAVFERLDPMDMVNTKLDNWLNEVLS